MPMTGLMVQSKRLTAGRPLYERQDVGAVLPLCNEPRFDRPCYTDVDEPLYIVISWNRIDDDTCHDTLKLRNFVLQNKFRNHVRPKRTGSYLSFNYLQTELSSEAGRGR